MSLQQNLFDTEPAPWELDDAGERLVATVVLATGPEGEFDYLVPEPLVGQAEAGRRVQVPLGRSDRAVVGYCVRVETQPVGGRKLKSLSRVVDRQTLLSPSMLRLTRWIADYYLCRWGRVLEAVLPAGVRGQAGTRDATLLRVSPKINLADKLAQLEASEKTARQAHVLRKLAESDRPLMTSELAERAGCSPSTVGTLRKKGLIHAHRERISNFEHQEKAVDRELQLEMNGDQQAALDTILQSLHSSQHQTILIHGVTGSGKTEVYMQAIHEVLSFGRQAIVLVPEISLTPQTRERFRRRFDRIAVLHSHLSDAERAWHWDQIAQGHVQVVVGARSAIFAPTPNLGLIILDEEHESSFKQGEAPRYHARDVAIYRAETEKVPLVLGSATPSLESWQRAAEGAYRLVSMPRRVMDRPLPEVATIDLRSETLNKQSRGAVSRQLHQAMEAALKDGGQVILLLNRRGFATHIQCPACGLVVQCPDCEIALTHHRAEETALCHYCDYQIPAPAICPDCKFTGIRYSGRGTEKLEAEVRSRFPQVPCLRMDTDSMKKPGSHERALEAFRRGEVRILLGTQMIAKGLDFPNVTLVGVVNADTALHLPDFRAGERSFQLVTQVAGRTERGGRVLVQTFNPDHPAIQAAVRHDYDRFARAELPERRKLGYPPFGEMVRLVVRGPVEKPLEEFTGHIAERVRAAADRLGVTVRLLGPAPCPMPKLRGLYRFQLQVQSPHGPHLRQAVQEATADLQGPDEIQWIVDVDPLDMM